MFGALFPRGSELIICVGLGSVGNSSNDSGMSHFILGRPAILIKQSIIIYFMPVVVLHSMFWRSLLLFLTVSLFNFILLFQCDRVLYATECDLCV